MCVCAFKPKLCYHHLQKAGGTFSKKVLKQLLGNEVVLSPERRLFCNATKHFIIGGLRDPCSWYLSLWTYGVEGNGGL